MINQGTYENLSYELIAYAEIVIYEVSELLKELNNELINDPDSIIYLKKDYQNKVIKIIEKYKENADKWIESAIAAAYIKGIKHSESILKSNGLNYKITSKIENGDFLIKKPPGMQTVPPIPNSTLKLFEGIEDHTKFYGVFRNAAYYSIDKQPLQILRETDDIYRQVSIISGDKYYKEGNIFTRRKLSQSFLDEFAKKGVQSITYKDGRKVSIDSYSEMLGRTITGRAAVQASLNRFVESGYELGIVSAHFRACDLCTPYEGVVLSLTGKHPVYESIWDAELQGLFHCNCKHDISVFFEGMPKPEIMTHPEEKKLINEYGYDEAQKLTYQAQVRQREIERNIRYWKRRSLTSLDKKTELYSNKKVKEWQSKQREHLSNNKFLKRQYQREQINKSI